MPCSVEATPMVAAAIFAALGIAVAVVITFTRAGIVVLARAVVVTSAIVASVREAERCVGHDLPVCGYRAGAEDLRGSAYIRTGSSKSEAGVPHMGLLSGCLSLL